MRAGVFFTGSGPILLLTSYGSLEAPGLVRKLETKGIKKYIACEVSEELVKEKYGNHYNVVMGDLQQEDDLRVLDWNGHHVFYTFKLRELGKPIFHEE